MEIMLTGTGSMWSTDNSASALINNNISIDFPNGSYKALLRMGADPGKIDHVVITHTHGDHILDLPVWALGKVKPELHKDGEDVKPKPRIYASEKAAGLLRTLISMSFSESLNEEALNDRFEFVTDDEFEIDGLSFKRVTVSHGKSEAFGYMVNGGNRTVSFSGDSCLCEGLTYMAERSGLFICETAKVKKSSMHLNVQDMIDFAAAHGSCEFVTTHMNDETREELLRQRLPRNLTVGTDGMRIEV